MLCHRTPLAGARGMSLGVNVMHGIHGIYLRSLLVLGFAAFLLIQTLASDTGNPAAPAISGASARSPH